MTTDPHAEALSARVAPEISAGHIAVSRAIERLRGTRLSRADIDRLTEFLETRTDEPERVGVRVVSSEDPTEPVILELRQTWLRSVDPTNVIGVRGVIAAHLPAFLAALDERGFNVSS